MDDLKNSLVYKLLREFKNLFLQIWMAFYWQILRISTIYKDHYEDKRLGIETGECQLWRDNSLHRDMISHVPAPYADMRRIIDYLKMTPEDVFIDLGCGKGRALFVAASENLKKAIGVELDERLLAVAGQNLQNAKTLNCPVEIVAHDAATYNIDLGTVFFFYNPFGHNTMAKVLDNIKFSLEKSPRRAHTVYYCPQYRYLFDEAPWLEFETELNNGRTVIWRNKKP